jgi:glucosamine--fructose-6-phosphate aminotransferase (isomerizing)
MTFMALEAREAPEAVERFLKTNAKALRELGQRLRSMDPPVILTSARGSSDHAAAYLKYISEILLGIPCASVGASVASVYGAKLRAKNALAITISQSGKSPDIVALQRSAQEAGALTVALINAENSPAASTADIFLPLCAGPERSVAATKSFIVSLVASAAIVSAWLGDPALERALLDLPEQLRRVAVASQPDLQDLIQHEESLFVLGRGPSFPIACETALKLKETCGLHAEAYSVAEVMHGPLELVEQGFPILVFAQDDVSFAGTQAAIAKLQNMGARVLVLTNTVAASHPLLSTILLTQSTYLSIEKLSRSLGRNPDAPRHLHKVTETT